MKPVRIWGCFCLTPPLSWSALIRLPLVKHVAAHLLKRNTVTVLRSIQDDWSRKTFPVYFRFCTEFGTHLRMCWHGLGFWWRSERSLWHHDHLICTYRAGRPRVTSAWLPSHCGGEVSPLTWILWDWASAEPCRPQRTHLHGDRKHGSLHCIESPVKHTRKSAPMSGVLTAVEGSSSVMFTLNTVYPSRMLILNTILVLLFRGR